jgi:hypothetical protein
MGDEAHGLEEPTRTRYRLAVMPNNHSTRPWRAPIGVLAAVLVLLVSLVVPQAVAGQSSQTAPAATESIGPPTIAPSAMSSAEPGFALPVVPAGSIVGVYVQEDHDGQGLVLPAGVTIGVYAAPFLPGTDMFSPPLPLATSTTADGGMFSFEGLQSGTYFLTTIGSPAFAQGATVLVTAERGAFVVLTGCTDCPAPA